MTFNQIKQLLVVVGVSDELAVFVSVGCDRLKVRTPRVTLTWFTFKPHATPGTVHTRRLKLRPSTTTNTTTRRTL